MGVGGAGELVMGTGKAPERTRITDALVEDGTLIPVAVEGFRSGRYKVMVATDIAARGLDIDGIHTVINYELPDSPESYVHRVGRTGRADEAGHAITLVSPAERHVWASMEKSVGVVLE